MNQHYHRGNLLLGQGRFDLAIEEFRKSITLDPDWSGAHSALALALLRSGRTQEAVKTAETALEKDPNNDSAHWMMALIRVERREFKAAEAAIRQAIELDPGCASNRGLLARILCEQNRGNEALEAADAGLAIDPTDDLCLTFRARALMDLGRKDEADQIAGKLLEADPEDEWNHCLRAEQLLLQGDAAGARTHYLEALRIDPRNDVARQGLATSLKARSPIYGVLLKVLLQMGRLQGWAMWVALITFFLALRFGDRFVLQHPDWLVPYEGAKALFWGALIVVLIANPIFDLLLRFDRDGRHALSTDELRATNWYLVCMAFGALCLAWMWFGKGAALPRGMAMASFFLCNAVSQVFEATPGYVRKRMALFTALASACLVLTPFAIIAGVLLIRAKVNFLGPQLILLPLWMPAAVMLYTAFAENLRESLEKRRPDSD